MQTIDSVPAELESYKNRLNNLTDWQREISKKGFKVTFPDNSEIEFIWIPSTTSKEWQRISAGRDYYVMGDDLETYSPNRFVRLTYGFFIAKTEITQSQWKALMADNPSVNRYIQTGDLGNHPVNSVSRKDSNSFINKFTEDASLSVINRLKKYFYYKDYRFRLPTEAEWEYAARAGMFKPSDEYIEKTTWSASQGTANVASKSPNPWGINDMLGNVFELTYDCWPMADEIQYGEQDRIITNPVGLLAYLNTRGGAYHSRNYHVKSFGWRRNCKNHEYSEQNVGLRLVLAPPVSELKNTHPGRSKPQRKLVSEQKTNLKMTSGQKCNNNLNIDAAYITKEYNNYILLDVCYEYNGEIPLSLTAITYDKGRNTGKWWFRPGVIKPGHDCTTILLGKSSFYAYNSDSILVKTHDYECEAIFEFEKLWTNGLDITDRQVTEDRPADKYRLHTYNPTYQYSNASSENVKDVEHKSIQKQSKEFSNNSKNKNFKVNLPDDSRIEFVWIPPTTSTDWKNISGGLNYYVFGDNFELTSPYRLVKLTYGYFISTTEITQRQWETIMFRNPSNNNGINLQNTSNFPVNNISWENTQEFIKRFSQIDSVKHLTSKHKNSNYEFRLPTEVEWEYAAKAGMYLPDKEFLDKSSWYKNNAESIRQVATKQTNEWGIHDMIGNVNELTSDCWPTSDETIYGKPYNIRINPVGDLSKTNFRGGTYYSEEQVVSFGWRSGCQHPTHRTYYTGARLVLAPSISMLNPESEPLRIPESILVNNESQPLNIINNENVNCENQLNIESTNIKKEYNDHIFINVCYDYKGIEDIWLSGVTYLNGNNTDKSGYIPGQIKTGKDCTEIGIYKNSQPPYNSDSIVIKSTDNKCEAMFGFDKYWTDGADIIWQ